jgi:hypothetical protein
MRRWNLHLDDFFTLSDHCFIIPCAKVKSLYFTTFLNTFTHYEVQGLKFAMVFAVFSSLFAFYSIFHKIGIETTNT